MNFDPNVVVTTIKEMIGEDLSIYKKSYQDMIIEYSKGTADPTLSLEKAQQGLQTEQQTKR